MDDINNDELNSSRILRASNNGADSAQASNHDRINTINISNREGEPSYSYIQDSFKKINDTINKIEGEKIGSLNQELSYIRHVLDFQNSKIDKLTSLIAEVMENRNQNAMIGSLLALNDAEQGQGQEQEQNQVDNAQVGEHVAQHLGQLGAVAGNGSGLPNQDSLAHAAVQLDSNMDPQLHQVAAAAVQQATEALHRDTNLDLEKYRKKIYLRRKLDEADDSATTDNDSHSIPEAKKPKISVDFLHNPMTVKEIYDEYTKGFRGQPPLCEMDARFGKHDWRGDLRSKESKRFQRRKKLCDAIARGMKKYNKSADEIIRYIEEFRGDKSLTWIMNGNLPPDLTM